MAPAAVPGTPIPEPDPIDLAKDTIASKVGSGLDRVLQKVPEAGTITAAGANDLATGIQKLSDAQRDLTKVGKAQRNLAILERAAGNLKERLGTVLTAMSTDATRQSAILGLLDVAPIADRYRAKSATVNSRVDEARSEVFTKVQNGITRFKVEEELKKYDDSEDGLNDPSVFRQPDATIAAQPRFFAKNKDAMLKLMMVDPDQYKKNKQDMLLRYSNYLLTKYKPVDGQALNAQVLVGVIVTALDKKIEEELRVAWSPIAGKATAQALLGADATIDPADNAARSPVGSAAEGDETMNGATFALLQKYSSGVVEGVTTVTIEPTAPTGGIALSYSFKGPWNTAKTKGDALELHRQINTGKYKVKGVQNQPYAGLATLLEQMDPTMQLAVPLENATNPDLVEDAVITGTIDKGIVYKTASETKEVPGTGLVAFAKRMQTGARISYMKKWDEVIKEIKSITKNKSGFAQDELRLEKLLDALTDTDELVLTLPNYKFLSRSVTIRGLAGDKVLLIEAGKTPALKTSKDVVKYLKDATALKYKEAKQPDSKLEVLGEEVKREAAEAEAESEEVRLKEYNDVLNEYQLKTKTFNDVFEKLPIDGTLKLTYQRWYKNYFLDVKKVSNDTFEEITKPSGKTRQIKVDSDEYKRWLTFILPKSVKIKNIP